MKPQTKNYYCEKCGTEMTSTGKAIECFPIQYPHKCPKCGRVENLSKVYPYVWYGK